MIISELKFRTNTDFSKFNHDMKKATRAAEKLAIALSKLENIEIGFELIKIKKRWWQFWK